MRPQYGAFFTEKEVKRRKMYDTTEKFNAIKDSPDVLILGIESSCDETAAAVVRNGREVLSNVIASQIEIHRRYGGVVPEVASRNHTMAVNNVISEALDNAGVTLDKIDAIAVTYGAGLVGALLVGVTAAKSLSYASGIPLIKVDHIEGHIAANYVAFPDLEPPFLAVVASGGHTLIIDVTGYNEYKVLGSTRDDAIGEAFDKTARLLGLPYPGGPEIDRLAKLGKNNIEFIHRRHVSEDLSLSYSGLKTAVVNYVHNLRQKNKPIPVEDVCASLTSAAVDMLVDAVMVAAKKSKRKNIVLAGGVASNSYLRASLAERGEKSGYKVCFPPPVLCTDNAVMIASRGYYSAKAGLNQADLTLNAVPDLVTGGAK